MAPPHAREAFTLFVGLLSRVLPALAVVFLLLFVANLVMEQPWIERHLGRESGFGGWLIAVAAGVLAAGSLYAWYALVGELKQKGLRPGLAAAFLYVVSVKLPLLPLLVDFFGLTYAIVLNAWLILFAVLGGLLVERFEIPRRIRS
ncbi:MAG: permease [Nitrospiraceae bacterium]|nr:MAG: permease [Nitrospiraceae bacterium]